MFKHCKCLLIAVMLASVFSKTSLAAIQALELELVGAAPNQTPLRIDADVDGPAVMWMPYLPLQAEIGKMAFVEAEGKLNLEKDEITGTLSGQLPGPPKRYNENVPPVSFNVQIQAKVSNGVVTGRWKSGEETGPIHGLVRAVPEPEKVIAGAVTLDRAYPWPGREGGVGYNGLQTRLGAVFTLKEGEIIEGTTSPNRPKASWFPKRSFNPVAWYLADGTKVILASTGYEHGQSSVSGSLNANTLSINMIASVERQDKPVQWQVALKRAGTLWYGKWSWTVEKGQKDLTGWAAARLSASGKLDQHDIQGTDGKAKLLRHALALYQHPANTPFRDDLLAMVAAGTGNKQYDNPPNNLAGAIFTGLLLDKLSDDPAVRAEGRAMARRAAYWWQMSRIGPLQVGEYYKGMFYTTAWAGLGLAALTETDPNGPWKEWSAELADSLQRAQLESGAWTWVDEETGKRGKSNDRHDRSRDNREMNCGDLLLALSHLARATDKPADESISKADRFLAKTLKSPPDWFFKGRRPDDSPEAMGTLCYLQWLVEQPKPDQEKITLVRQIIDREFVKNDSGLIVSYAPRWAGADHGNTDLSATARYVHILAILGEQGDEKAANEAARLGEIILKKAGGSGLIDYLGRDLPADPVKIGKEDYHPYLCMKAAIGWELLKAMEASEHLKKKLSRSEQTIQFPALPNVPVDQEKVTPNAKATSKLPVQYTILSGPAELKDGDIVLTGQSGVVRVQASQPGNDDFFKAAAVTRAFAVGDAAPAEPTNLQVTPLRTDRLRLTWNDASEDETGFRIDISEDGQSWRHITKLPANTTSHDIGSLQPARSYMFRVASFNRAVASDPTKPVQATTLKNATTIQFEAEAMQLGQDWKVIESKQASGNQAIEASTSNRKGWPDEDKDADIIASHSFEIDTPGVYTIHYCSWGNSGANDSQFMQIKGSDTSWQVLTTGNSGQFDWYRTEVEFTKSGQYTLQLGCREATGKIDQVVITNGPWHPKN